jgi:ribose 5-phosphate isomerase A
MDMDDLKRQAAYKAVELVEDGMVVGLGTGSTAKHAVDRVAQRMREEGLRVIGVPTSSRTREQARGLGIPLASLEDEPALDLAIDGADEIELGTLSLIKGAGGALLQEKLVEVSARTLVIIADESKKVHKLGGRFAVPVEVVRFGWKSTRERLRALGCDAVLRGGDDPYITDEQHYLLDCNFGLIDDAATLADAIKSITGVVEHGLFIGMASRAILATRGGIEILLPRS